MRNYWDPAEEPLRRLALTEDPARWEYAAVAATALASYPSMETFEALKRCLSSTSWFVRHNAAKALHDWGLSLDDLDDVMHGSDLVRARHAAVPLGIGGHRARRVGRHAVRHCPPASPEGGDKAGFLPPWKAGRPDDDHHRHCRLVRAGVPCTSSACSSCCTSSGTRRSCSFPSRWARPSCTGARERPTTRTSSWWDCYVPISIIMPAHNEERHGGKLGGARF